MSIENKVVVITGASSGIGRATAIMLARQGAKLVLGARREAPLKELVNEISAYSSEVTYALTDVSNREDMQCLVNFACSRFGRLDVLIANAGIGPISPLDELRVDDWEAMIDINLKGYLYGVAAALPIFRQQEAGHFVSVISTSGLRIVAGQAVYAGTKNAVRTINEALRIEAGEKLRVTGVSPGFVKTQFADSMTDPATQEKVKAAMDMMGMSPDAISRAIVFAIDQPDDVDVGDIVVRPTAQA
ncbi:SDR family oxidoreductase [Marinomonas sp. C2222]|uniref:SDR family oxidoreductase n=1 Tax=Marinomonas sargassi TaxID=2984494 RepID=A0ABT2YQU2_9GAMM|nr:SDR family oxidoreductase [Marinomonas sargassi]MCV2402267.1 SDR family oxidoreductase [Marinomonas sargassi]